MKNLLFLILVLILPVISIAQNYTITGSGDQQQLIRTDEASDGSEVVITSPELDTAGILELLYTGAIASYNKVAASELKSRDFGIIAQKYRSLYNSTSPSNLNQTLKATLGGQVVGNYKLRQAGSVIDASIGEDWKLYNADSTKVGTIVLFSQRLIKVKDYNVVDEDFDLYRLDSNNWFGESSVGRVRLRKIN